MIKIIYPNIVIETITDKVTMDNYGKQDYVVFDTNGDYLFTMYHQFITLPIAEGLCSADMKSDLLEWYKIDTSFDTEEGKLIAQQVIAFLQAQDSQEEEHLYEYVDAFAEGLAKLGEH